MMHAAMIAGHGVDGRVALHQDEASPGCVEEHHMPVWCGGQMPAADDLRVELGAFRNVAHRNAEMSNRLDRNHLTSPRADSLSNRTAYGRSPSMRWRSAADGRLRGPAARARSLPPVRFGVGVGHCSEPARDPPITGQRDEVNVVSITGPCSLCSPPLRGGNGLPLKSG